MDLTHFSERFTQTDPTSRIPYRRLSTRECQRRWPQLGIHIHGWNFLGARSCTWSSREGVARYIERKKTGSIKRAIRRKHRAYRKSKRTNTKRDRDRYKRLQQHVQWEIRRANRQYMQDIVSESYTDKPKRFWSYVKSKGQESMGVAPLGKIVWLSSWCIWLAYPGIKFWQRPIQSCNRPYDLSDKCLTVVIGRCFKLTNSPKRPTSILRIDVIKILQIN